MHASGAGLGFKPVHVDEAMHCVAEGLWLEVHPENYMVDGGPRLAMLEALADRHPLSMHGVSLSIAADAPPDPEHLARWRRLIDRVRPVLVSEHLAWSTWDGRYAPDLLPFPRSHEALARVVDNVQRTQEALGRTIALENPSAYLALDGNDWSETDFLGQVVRRTGCDLLLDINNVFVSAHNLGFDAIAYLDAFPASAVSEIHLAGHTVDLGSHGELMIDSHDAPVAETVWHLYRYALGRIGAVPTLIERDGELPAFDVLLAERDRAQRCLMQEGVAA